MASTFLVLETDRGGRELSDQAQSLDEHPTLDAALEHLRSVPYARDQIVDVVVRYHDEWIWHATG